MTKLLGFIVLMLIGISVTLLSGVVLADFWRWFVLPVFTVPPITYLQAVGLMYVAVLFKQGLATTDTGEGTGSAIADGFAVQAGYVLALLLTWGLGALWSLFI